MRFVPEYGPSSQWREWQRCWCSLPAPGRGRYATASVRGTVWQTEDRCDGTQVKVVKGRVSVRDLVRKRTVTEKAGRSCFASKKRKRK